MFKCGKKIKKGACSSPISMDIIVVPSYLWTWPYILDGIFFFTDNFKRKIFFPLGVSSPPNGVASSFSFTFKRGKIKGRVRRSFWRQNSEDASEKIQFQLESIMAAKDSLRLRLKVSDF